MPNYTDKYQFPSPRMNESADGPTGFQQLAQRVEDVLASQFTALISSGPEIAVAGDPLVASLTGKRQGDWLVGTDVAGGQANLSAAAGAVDLALLKNGAAVHALEMNGDDVLHKIGTVSRPLPFATFCKYAIAKITNATAGSALVTYPGGRFTQVPITVATTSGAYYFPSLSAGSTTSITIIVRHYQAVTDTIDVGFDMISIQTTRLGLAPDLKRVSTQGTTTIRVTCHNLGCENAGVALDCLTEDPDVRVICGPCGGDITDVEV